MKIWLIDTGPLVAYLNRNDATHGRVAAALDGFTGQLCTTSAVITEVMYFLSDLPNGPPSFAELLRASAIRIAESTQPPQIRAAAELMSKYADTPMDFADATLVLLADELGVMDILTLDRRGFSTYRTTKGRAFRLVLS
ncbi:MAG: PIN domain-containing protein [Acidobacteria bacterium]|nr:PIN domain-containing protein [Acidobacteriota bacterium]